MQTYLCRKGNGPLGEKKEKREMHIETEQKQMLFNVRRGQCQHPVMLFKTFQNTLQCTGYNIA